jgi:Mce-associated membrane protein
VKIDSPEMTEPNKAQGRSRSGLAKLRGAPTEAPAPAAVTPTEAPAQPPTAVVETPAKVDLIKPDAPAGDDGRPAQKGGQGGIRRLGTVVVALAVVLALLLWGAFSFGGQAFRSSKASSSAAANTNSQGTPDQRLAVLRSGRQFAVSFFTYDYRKIDDYLRRVENTSTGAFRADFVSKEKTLKTVVAQLKTVASGQVPDTGAGIVQLKGDSAVVLVAANFNASNAVTKNGQRRYRMKLALQLVKGQWLVSDFQQVV